MISFVLQGGEGFIKKVTSIYETAEKYGIVDIAVHPFIYADLLIRVFLF